MQTDSQASQPETDRRKTSFHFIEALISERNKMLVLYNKLAAIPSLENSPEAEQMLQKFCEILIDYTADAHFRLYRYIDERKERRRSVLAVADRVYPRIVQITQTILDFNDKYDGSGTPRSLKNLGKDLSFLGEQLADRIELEDKVVDVLSEDNS